MATGKWIPNSIQKELMRQFGIQYGEDASSWYPQFGGVRLPLLNQEYTSLDGKYDPTSSSLVRHCGFLQYLADDVEFYNCLLSRPDELRRRIRAAEMEMDRKVVQPIRKYLDRCGMYFYRSSAIHMDVHNITGQVKIMREGPQVVKLLPIDSDVGRLYGMKKRALQQIAEEVVYVLDRRKLAYRTVKEEAQLLRLVDGWMNYIGDIRVRAKLWNSFKQKAPSSIMTSRVQQQFLLQPEDVMMSTKRDIRKRLSPKVY